MHTYAIGDIHGHLSLLIAVHDLIAQDMARHGSAPVVHLGDLVDRGPDSRGVIEFLLQGLAAGADWIVLKGNHDRMFARFLRDPAEPNLVCGLNFRGCIRGWAGRKRLPLMACVRQGTGRLPRSMPMPWPPCHPRIAAFWKCFP